MEKKLKMGFLGKRSSKIIGVVIIVLVVIAAVKIRTNYTRRDLELEMDMCDLDGNVIHVTVNGVLRRGWGEHWKLSEGEIRYDGKVFVDWEYEEDELVPSDFKAEGKIMASPGEWLNSFRAADRKDGTYYFMPYQHTGEMHREGSVKYYTWQEGDSINYFGPASTKEEAQRINDIWVQVFRGK